MRQCHHKFGFIRDGIQEIEKRRDENVKSKRRIKDGRRTKQVMRAKGGLRTRIVKEAGVPLLVALAIPL